MLKPYSNKVCNVIKKYELNSVLTEESKTMILKYCDTGKLISIWLESLDKSNKILLKEGEK